MKNGLILAFLISISCGLCHAQMQKALLVGNWKFSKIELNGTYIDLNNLTSSYFKFYHQKKKVYNNTPTVNDSLYIHYLFEKLVNEVDKMFFNFSEGNLYQTNYFSSKGEITDSIETGKYLFYPNEKRLLTTTGVKPARWKRYRVLSLTKQSLILKLAGEPAALFTLKRTKVD